MLFFINKTDANIFDRIKLLGGDEEKEVLLVGDAVFLGNEAMVAKFKALGVEKIYAMKDALDDRSVNLSDECEVVDYDAIVPIIMEEHDKIISV